MNRWGRFKAGLVMCLGVSLLWPGSALPELRLVKRIPFSEIVNDHGEPLKAKDIASPDPSFTLATEHPRQGYGFIKGGKAFTPGWGGWVLDLETEGWTREFPGNLRNVSVTKDGTKLYAQYEKDPGSGFESFAVDTLTGEPWDGDMMMHPDNQAWVEIGWGKTTNAWIEEISIGGKPVPLKGRYVASVDGFTADGRSLIIDERRLIDARAMRLLPVDAEMAENGKPSSVYIGDSQVFVFNHDASWVAGKKGANDWSTFVWDRINKRFLWKDPMVSEPSAFSPNSKFLYCCDTINEAATGKVVFENLKGYRGKFSPDGLSLVAVDDEAFYVYTLPKESEPIFGVFQKPEPWSPPKAAKRPGRKTIKKP